MIAYLYTAILQRSYAMDWIWLIYEMSYMHIKYTCHGTSYSQITMRQASYVMEHLSSSTQWRLFGMRVGHLSTLLFSENFILCV